MKRKKGKRELKVSSRRKALSWRWRLTLGRKSEAVAAAAAVTEGRRNWRSREVVMFERELV